MQVFTEETDVPDVHVMRSVLGLFDRRPHMQRIIKCGLLGIEYDENIDIDDYDDWAGSQNSFHGFSNSGRVVGGSHPGPPSFVYHPALHYGTSARSPSCPPFVKVQAKESDSERRARLLQEAKRNKEKAEKKRLKKQKQKQRKQMEKEKQNPAKDNEKKDEGEPSKSEEDKCVGDETQEEATSSDKQAAAKDTDSDSDNSEHESSDEDGDSKVDSEELDMTSSFVSKAALIAKRQLEQNPRSEKKKNPDKEKPKNAADKAAEGHKLQKEDCSSSFVDNVKISTELAILGNKFANLGDYSMAVKYFTDAIKYNPKEFKLFGNRSFCYEKLLEYDKALTDAELSLAISPGWVKGLFRKGRALAGLKRYEEAAQAFKGVLKLESSYAEAAQELMRVQMIQLMECGFTREQSSNALIIHGTVHKALEALSKLACNPEALRNGTPPPAQVANVNGVSPILSANRIHSPSAESQKTKRTDSGPNHDAPPLLQNQPTEAPRMKDKEQQQPPPGLFPVWVGNLTHPVPESAITKVFNKAGPVYSVKILQYKRCAFVNYTKQEHCQEAIQRLHGYVLNGMKIAVRYPDRIPAGMGISKSALKARDLHAENPGQGRHPAGDAKSLPPFRPPDRRGAT
ncbi:Tetratricopeptide repeat protein 31 [Oryzias melastigma]|uniref:Tetratricopeptide repeat protein 31 n=1 Tax=Oryzias melastigma TaxID=30732 RepID=A0A834EZR7_ORYME|nr:Tetratricopeptide repeat protein 31 [Oryzias melastigma]